MLSWQETAIRLSETADAEEVAESLVALGILEKGQVDQYRMAGVPPADLSSAPSNAYTSRFGDIVGLSKNEFIALMQSDDYFWNVLFWQVADAFMLERIGQADLPSSVVKFFNLRKPHQAKK